LGHIHRNLGELHLAARQTDEAHEAFRKAGMIFHSLKNRHLLQPISERLEQLRRPGAVQAVEFSLPEEKKDTALSLLATEWQAKYRATSLSIASDDQFLQALLIPCLDLLKAEEVSIFRCMPAPQLLAARDAQGSKPALRTNPIYLEQVLASRSALTAIDLPGDMAIGLHSNLETEIPSLLVAPLHLNGEIKALLYLTRWDISNPFDEASLELVEGFCEMLSRDLGDRLIQRTLAPHSEAASRLSEELRFTLKDKSLLGSSQTDWLQTVLGACAEKLGADEICLLSGTPEPVVVAVYSGLAAPTAPNMAFVSQVAQSGLGLCALDMPAHFNQAGASFVETRIPSVAVAPLPTGGTIYCIRHSLDEPFSDDDLPAVDACAKVLAESLQGVS
jgi:GAF domain-containing protein